MHLRAPKLQAWKSNARGELILAAFDGAAFGAPAQHSARQIRHLLETCLSQHVGRLR